MKNINKTTPIIAKNGEKAVVRKLNDEEYLKELKIKLQEEVNEYMLDENVEELADIVEVIYALLDAKSVTIDEFEQIRKQKVEKRGTFKEKIFLESTM